jgi:hypothetical protein
VSRRHSISELRENAREWLREADDQERASLLRDLVMALDAAARFGSNGALIGDLAAVLSEPPLDAEPAALDCLARAAARARASFAEALYKALVAATRAQAPTARARADLASAATRERAYSAERRMALAMLAMPEGLEAALGLLPAEGSPAEQAIAKLTFLGPLIEAPGSRAAAERKAVEVLTALAPDERTEVLQHLTELPVLAPLLPLLSALAACAAATHDASHAPLTALARRMGADAEPLLAWLLASGHPAALEPALDALEARATLESAPALRVACGHPDPGIATAVRGLLARVDEERAPAPTSETAAAVRAHLAGAQDRAQPRWGFHERHLAVMAAPHLDADDAPAPAREELLDALREHLRHRRGPYLALALEATGAPSWREQPGALALSLEALEGEAPAREAAARALRRRRLAGALALTPAQRAGVVAALEGQLWDEEAQVELGFAGLPESLPLLLPSDAQAPAPHLPALHDALLAAPADARLLGVLETLYRQAPPVVTRGLLRRVGPDSDPGYLPAWAALATGGAPDLRLEATAAIGRVGGAGAEPALLERLAEDADPAVRAAAIEGLAAIGTRAALEGLSGVSGKLARRARDAAAAIRRRAPAADLPAPGALSIAAGEGGALSVASEAGEGALSVAGGTDGLEPAEEPAGEPPPARRPDQPPGAVGWARLSAAPRRLPPALSWVTLLLGPTLTFERVVALGVGLIPLPVTVALIARAVINGGVGDVLSIWALVQSVCTVWLVKLAPGEHRGAARFLRDGEPSTARLIQHETRRRVIKGKKKDREVTEHRYRFEVMGEDGRWHARELPWGERKPELEGSDPEAVLSLRAGDGSPGEIFFCDRLHWTTLDATGQPRPTPQAVKVAAALTAWLLGSALLLGLAFAGLDPFYGLVFRIP